MRTAPISSCRNLLFGVITALFLMIFPPAIAHAQVAAPDKQMTDAQDQMDVVHKDIKSCASIDDRIERLICFDKMAKELGYTPPEKAEREEQFLEKIGFWQATKRRSAAGEFIIYIKNDSVEPVVSAAGIQRKPTLVLKCKNGQTDVYLDWKSRFVPPHLGGITKQPMQYQFDASAPIFAKWELSTDRQAVFAPDPVEFVKQMRKHSKIVFNMTPPSDIAQTIVHDISGLNSILPILVKECYK